MTAADTIHLLHLRGGQPGDPLDPEAWRHATARLAWVRETMAAYAEAQRQMDDRCSEAAGRMSEEEFNRLFDEEQAKVDAIRRRIDDLVERDRWPREWHRGCV